MNQFDKRLVELEREVENLKTTATHTSSSLAVTRKTVDITQQIVGYTVNYENDNCASKYTAIVELIPTDGKNMLSSASVVTNRNEISERRVSLFTTMKNGHNAYEFRIAAGSDQDLQKIQNGQTIPPISFQLAIFGTSDFSLNLTYRQDY